MCDQLNDNSGQTTCEDAKDESLSLKDGQSDDDIDPNTGQTSDKRLNEESNDETTEQSKNAKKLKKVISDAEIKKSNKRGIVYLSYIPFGLNVNKIRQLLSEYGEVERIYLEKQRSAKEGDNNNNKKKKTKKSYNCHFEEGWVEFKKKSVAKAVAQMLNGKQIGGKRKTKFYDQIWSIKYLHKFKWSHLAEQLSYEKALRQQRLRLEIGRAKQETAFYEQMANKFKYNKRHNNAEQPTDKRVYKQRLPDEVIRQTKTTDNDVDYELLSKIFN